MHIRPYERADRDRFLSLYEAVWGRRKGRDWFDWRFESNPYREDVRMIVAEEDAADGERMLVGAEPLLPFQLRVGSTTVDAYQPVDWIVHPEFRRQGVFSRMTELLFEEYDDADLLFNFPSDVLLPGLEKFGWRVVGDTPMSYRVQRPSQLFSGGGRLATDTLTSSALALCGPAVKLTLKLLDRTASTAPGLTVSRQTEVPVETLGSLYETTMPEQVHVARDEEFLRWRFANPNWQTRTYVASKEGEPLASVVTGREQANGVTCVTLLDVQPMIPPDDRTDAVRAILSRILRDNDDADIVKASSRPYAGLLRRYGFWEDTSFPLSHVATTSTHVVRPLGGGPNAPEAEGAWSVAGRSLEDPGNWHLMPADLDIE